jgi:hypothetical protein
VLAASCIFKLECQNSSSCYQELQKQAPALMQVKRKMTKKIQTSHTHRAICQLQLQGKVSKFKLSLTRALETSPSLHASQKNKLKKKTKTSHTHKANYQLQLQPKV